MTGLMMNLVALGQIDTVCIGDQGVSYSYQKNSPYSTVSVWTVEGQDSGNVVLQQVGDTVLVDWNEVAPGQYYDLTVQEFNVFNDSISCEGLPVTDSVYIWPPPQFEIETTDPDNNNEICAGDTIELFPDKTYVDYQWSNGSHAESVRYGYNTNLSQDTSKYIYLTVTDWQSCQGKDSIYLTTHRLPRVNIGSDKVLCETDNFEILANSDVEAINYTWYVNDMAEPYAYTDLVYMDEREKFEQGIDSLWVMVEDIHGCISGDTIRILPCDEYLGEIPNLITPNGDGDNDYFKIKRLENYPNEYPDLIIEMYDRWGKLVWRSEPGYVSDPWGGRDFRGKKLPMDAYFYVIHLNNGTGKSLSGSVTVIR